MDRKCASCGEPEESADGIIMLDENCLCEACADRHEKGRIEAEDSARYGDHDYSMNW